MKSGFLQQVCAEAVERVKLAEAAVPVTVLRDRAASLPPATSFADALASPTSGSVAVIAEVKRASPSRGHMTDIPDPAGLATSYVRGGASAISVLTEPAHFAGALADLEAVTNAVQAPVIRKDFIVSDYQVWEARVAGAAAVLLIVAALSDAQLVDLMRTAADAGLDCLIETHSAGEVARGVVAHGLSDTGRRLILGVNARDLVTLEVDRGHVARVRADADLPAGSLLVAESGIRGHADVAEYTALGADAVLVGEHVATSADPEAAVRALLG